MIPLLHPEAHWVCPNCTSQLKTPGIPSKPILHPCRGMAGLLVPMVPAGTKCKIEVVERSDYVGSERVQVNGEGRPVMAAMTTRDEGQDTTVYAPCATIDLKEYR